MRKTFLRSIIFLHLILLSIYTYAGNLIDDEGSIHVRIEDSFYIGKDIGICISGGISVINNDQFTNKGNLNFLTDNSMESIFPDGNMGDGLFAFYGNGDHAINTGPGETFFGSLILETSGDVYLSGKLNVENELMLNSGLLFVEDGSELVIENSSPDAIRFDNTENCESYVVGELSLHVNNGDSYYFPIGDVNTFHPLFLSDIENKDVLTAAFDPVVPYELTPFVKNKSIQIMQDLGWIVRSAGQNDNHFNIGLSFNTNSQEGIPGVLHASAQNLATLRIDWGPFKNNGLYMTGGGKTTAGLFAIALQPDIKLPNFFIPGGSNGNTRFKIPNRNDYSNVKLIVFNRNGNVIYSNNNYAEGFDTKDYPSGTYFYELILEENNSTRTIYNFIEIKHEK